MSKNRIVAGIDIGSSKITTIIGQVLVNSITFETLVNVVGAATTSSRGVKKGQIVDIEEAVEATIASVEAAERMAGYSLSSAFVSVGGGHISSQNSTGVVAVSDPQGEVTGNDVERVIEAARAFPAPVSREIIHVIPQEFIVDGEAGVKDPVGMTGVRLEVLTHLITASSSALKNLTKTTNEVGIAIEDVVFSGLASSYSVLSETEKELGCVLVDIGAGTTTIAAYVDGSLSYSGSLPIGARNVTNDLAIGLRVSLETAEKIKLSLSANSTKNKDPKDTIEIADPDLKEVKKISRRTLVEGIIRPRLNEIFTMVKLDLEKSNLINKIPSGAVITGGGSMTVGVIDSAKRSMSLPVRVGRPVGIGGLVDDIMDPPYAVAVGLLIYGSKQSIVAPQGGLGQKIRLPNTGILGKVVESIRDLLP